MSFYKSSADNDGMGHAASPSSLYFNSYSTTKESLDDDLAALIGHHDYNSHSTNGNSNNSNDMYRPHPTPHDIFGVGVGVHHPSSFPASFHGGPQPGSDPFSHFSHPMHSNNNGNNDFVAPLPSPPDSSAAFPTGLAHRNSLSNRAAGTPTSRSRSRSKPARSTRGTAAQLATGAAAAIKRDISSPSPISTSSSSRPTALPIPISPLSMPGHTANLPPNSALHGLAQSLPHSHWSAYLQNNNTSANNAVSPSTPTYLPTPDSYSSFALGASSFTTSGTTPGMAHSLSAVSTMSTSPPQSAPAGQKDPSSPSADDPASKQ